MDFAERSSSHLAGFKSVGVRLGVVLVSEGERLRTGPESTPSQCSNLEYKFVENFDTKFFYLRIWKKLFFKDSKELSLVRIKKHRMSLPTNL